MKIMLIYGILQVIELLAFSIISFAIQKKYKLNAKKLEQYIKIINEIIFVTTIVMIVFSILAISGSKYVRYYGRFVANSIMGMFLIISLNKKTVNKRKKRKRRLVL